MSKLFTKDRRFSTTWTGRNCTDAAGGTNTRCLRRLLGMGVKQHMRYQPWGASDIVLNGFTIAMGVKRPALASRMYHNIF